MSKSSAHFSVRGPRVIKLVIGFEGTRYGGWQSQKNGKTVQETFEKILLKILKERTHLTGSSRTDSGVHALGFAASFKTKSKLPDKSLKNALNYYLPRDIVVYSAKTQARDFHARFDAKSKIYEYKIWNSPTRPLFEAPTVLWYPHLLDPALMKKAARALLGRHDFSAFQDKSGDERNPVRRLTRLYIRKEGALIRITVQGDGFLNHMVRIIAGTLIEAGRGKLKPEKVAQILRSRDRSQAGPTAKAMGLTLLKVNY